MSTLTGVTKGTISVEESDNGHVAREIAVQHKFCGDEGEMVHWCYTMLMKIMSFS